MNMENRQENKEAKRTLSAIGAFFCAAMAVLFCVCLTLSMKSSAEQALYSLLFPAFMFAAGCFASALCVHKRLALFALSAIVSTVASFALTLDIFRSLTCLGAFAVSAFLAWAIGTSRFTQSGVICATAGIYAAFILYGFSVLCFQKYGSVSLEGVLRAFDSLCNIILRRPEEFLTLLQELAATDSAYGALITEYQNTLNLLRELILLASYLIAPLFIYICSIGAFITVKTAMKQRRLLSLSNPLGEFSVGVVTAAVYLIIYFAMIFVDSTSALGVTLNTVSAMPMLGLFLVGFMHIRTVIRAHPKKQLFSVLLVLAAIFFTSSVITLLSLLGAYKTVRVYFAEKKNSGFMDTK